MRDVKILVEQLVGATEPRTLRGRPKDLHCGGS
jgi:hypothetical protein